MTQYEILKLADDNSIDTPSKDNVLAFANAIIKENEADKWISVDDRLPDVGFGASYMTFITEPVLMLGNWREDYPIVGHFVLQEHNDRMGCNASIKFKHPNGYEFYSATSPYIEIDNLGASFKGKLPLAFTKAVTHWQPLPPAMRVKDALKKSAN